MKLMIAAVVLGGVVAGCALLGPPQPDTAENAASYPQPQARQAPQPPAPASQPAPLEGAPAAAQPPAAPPQQQEFALGPAAGALVAEAQTQEQSRNFGLAAETLERALSIEPHNPLVWIALGRDNILAGNAAQAYGMGRKALYLATGDSHAQASAWELIAASLRAQGRNDEAYVAEEKAVSLSPQ
jgi:tetratricopeptide (TPR) repeat protein